MHIIFTCDNIVFDSDASLRQMLSAKLSRHVCVFSVCRQRGASGEGEGGVTLKDIEIERDRKREINDNGEQGRGRCWWG